MIYLFLLFLLIPFGFSDTFLLCHVEGTSSLPKEPVRKFKESISVSISEEGTRKYIDLEGSDYISETFVIKDYDGTGKDPLVKDIINSSDDTKWSIINFGEERKLPISNHLTINRMTGMIHVRKIRGPMATYFSGPCTKSSEKKF